MTKNTISPSKQSFMLSTSGFLTFLLLLVGVLGIDFIFGNSFSEASSVVFLAFMTATVVIVGSQPVLTEKFKKQPLVLFILYHILFVSFVIFIAPFGSFYIFLWISLTIYSEGLLGTNGVIASLVIMMLSLLGSLIQAGVDTIGTDQVIASTCIALLVASYAYYMSSKHDASEKDRTVLVTSIEKAQFERQRLLMLINSMGDGFIATDENGSIRLYNGAALDIIDSNQTLDDKNIADIITLWNKQNEQVDFIDEVRTEDRNIQRRDLHLKFGERDIKNIFTNITPIKLSFRNNAEKGFIIILRDITKVKSLEEERDEFISVISHELRTPITISEGNISNALLVAKKTDVDEKVKKSLNVAHDQIIFLAGMINDLSLLSRAENNSITDDIEEFPVAEVAENLVKTYQPDATKKNLILSVVDNTTDIVLTSNKLYLFEILQNFITNSIKYTDEGSVTIEINYNKEADKVTFDVIDTGIGISKSDQQKVFDKFFRSEDFRTRENNGTGLGLFITVKLAHKIRAEVDVHSELNKGSKFSITIPKTLVADE